MSGLRFIRMCHRLASREIKYDELLTGHKDKLIIDLRRQDEIAKTGIIPGAKNIPVQELESALNLSDEEFKGKYNFDKIQNSPNLVLHCNMGGRVKTAHSILEKMGFDQHRLYFGSMMDWLEKGGPTEK